MRYIRNIKQPEKVFEEMGYIKVHNGWVKYFDIPYQEKYNIERFHIVGDKIHIDGLRNNLHFVRRDTHGFLKYLIDTEVDTMLFVYQEQRKERKKEHLRNNPPNPNKKKKLKPEYAQNAYALQKMNLNANFKRPFHKELLLAIKNFIHR
jgi:hypothetical protein